jgi:hypothetical protein
MAFNTSTTPATTTTETTKGFVKADRFLNLYIKDNDGKDIKVSFIGLHENIPHENAIIRHLDANPESGITDVLNALSADYRSATSTKNFVGFKFGA